MESRRSVIFCEATSSDLRITYRCLPDELLVSPARLEFEHFSHRFDGSEENVYVSWQPAGIRTAPLSRQVQRCDAGRMRLGTQ